MQLEGTKGIAACTVRTVCGCRILRFWLMSGAGRKRGLSLAKVGCCVSEVSVAPELSEESEWLML